MKITAVKVTPVNIPLNFQYVWSMGVAAGYSKVVVEVETDQGITGIGEAPSTSLLPEIQGIADLLMGQDPMDIADCETAAIPEWKTLLIAGVGDGVAKAFGAFDTALWDIKGKVADMPLYQLLGGAYRKEIPFTEYFGFEGISQADKTYTVSYDPQAVADYCLGMKEEHGSTMFEGKLATHDDIRVDMDTVARVREAVGPECMIRLDANYGYSMATMKQMLRELEPLNIRNLEDPALTFEAMAELKRHTAIPLGTHQCDISRAAAAGAPDNFCGHPAALGGIMNTMRFIGACQQLGKNFWFYSGDAGITSTVYLHMAAACDHLTEPSQSLFRWQDMDVINEGPYRPENNVIRVPEGPGLGVTLDRDAMEILHKDYCDNGPSDQYYNFKNPARFTRLPRA